MMTGYEYKVVPAPTRPLKAKGVKGTSARFANALETVMNELGAEGWQYQRTDTLPVEERQGLTGKTTTFQNMLVFRRKRDAQPAEQAAGLIEDQSFTDDLSAPPQIAAHHANDIPETTEDSVTADRDTETTAADARVEATLNATGPTLPWKKRRQVNADDSLPAAE